MFTVDVEARAPEGVGPLDHPEVYMDNLMGIIEAHDGVCGVNETSWDASITVDADDAHQAYEAGVHTLLEFATKVDLPWWPLVRVEVIREDVLEEEVSRSNAPDLVSGPEVAGMLSVTRQRVHQLAADNPAFPKPLYKLGVGSLWTRSAIARFAEEWTRKPGRPRSRA